MTSRVAQAAQKVGGAESYALQGLLPDYSRGGCQGPQDYTYSRNGRGGVLTHGFFEEPGYQHVIHSQHRASHSLRGTSLTESTGSTWTKLSRKSCPARLQRNPLHCSVVQMERNMNGLSCSNQSGLPDVYPCTEPVVEEPGLSSLEPKKAALYFLSSNANTSNRHGVSWAAYDVNRGLDDRIFPSQHRLATSEDLRRAMAAASKGWTRSWRSRGDLQVVSKDQAKSLSASQSQGFQSRLRSGTHLKYRQIMSQLKRDSYSLWLEESARLRDLPPLPSPGVPISLVEICPSVEEASLPDSPGSTPRQPNMSPAAENQEVRVEPWQDAMSPPYADVDGLPDLDYFDDDAAIVQAMGANWEAGGDRSRSRESSAETEC